MTARISLLLVDDHLLFRESIARLIEHESDLQVVGQCATLADVRVALARTSPDVVLLDYDLGEEKGIDFIEVFEAQENPPRVLMVTGGVDARTTLSLLQARVAGVVLKHSEPRLLLEAIRRASAGGSWWDINPADALAAVAQKEEASTRALLTQRQQTILHFLLDGLTNKEIADRLHISDTSVKASIREMFAKAGVKTRGQLIRVALEKHSRDWLKPEFS